MHRSRDLGDDLDFVAVQKAYPQRFPLLLQNLTSHPGEEILFYDHGEPPLEGSRFLERIDASFAEQKVSTTSQRVGFRGGWFFYLGYELAREIEPRVPVRAPDPWLPSAFAVRCRVALERRGGKTQLVSEQGAGKIVRAARELLTDVPPAPAPQLRTDSVAEADPEHFLYGVERIKAAILAGDTYQVNLSRGWQVDGHLDAAALYKRLARANPAPFAASLRWRNTAVLSSSPERLVRVRDGVIETRPIAGTYPRLRDPSADLRQAQALGLHPKERAEHIMLIDLERNDLGRVCLPGTVSVDQLMTIETYAHVHHIVSNVRGALRPGVTPGAVLAAVFPGGTITGCPKVRTMQIISDLEAQPRGAYTGSIGYLNRDGSMDSNILIRTIVLRGDTARFRAGAGIVADSIPRRELEETRAKAKGLLRAFDA